MKQGKARRVQISQFTTELKDKPYSSMSARARCSTQRTRKKSGKQSTRGNRISGATTRACTHSLRASRSCRSPLTLTADGGTSIHRLPQGMVQICHLREHRSLQSAHHQSEGLDCGRQREGNWQLGTESTRVSRDASTKKPKCLQRVRTFEYESSIQITSSLSVSVCV